MILNSLPLEKMLDYINFQEFIQFDFIVPENYPGCPKLDEWKPPFVFENVPWSSHEPWTVDNLPKNSDLWNQFVRDRYKGVDKFKDNFNSIAASLKRDRIFGYLASVALENAFYHGNRNNPMLPVSFKVFAGSAGQVVRIRDSGIGFDTDKITNTLKRVEKRLGKPLLSTYEGRDFLKAKDRYFMRSGGGFAFYHGAREAISFDNNGSSINILYLFDGSYKKVADKK